MLNPFLTLDFHSKKLARQESIANFEAKSKSLARLMSEYSGSSFCEGLYRIHATDDVHDWTAHCIKMFPLYESRALCFASDWHGRQFAVDSDRRNSAEDECLCVMFDPNTALAFEIDSTLDDLHSREFVARADDLLRRKLYTDWLQHNPAPTTEECVAYEHPIFLGGAEIFENLECCSMEYYWEFTAELRSKTSHLPPGTKITRVVTKE